MKRLLFACIAALMALTTGTALAADLTGDWAGDLNTEGGVYPLTYHLKQAGTKLTGTIDAPGGESLLINDGKIEADKVTFTVQYNGSTIAHIGTVTDDGIKITTTGGEIGPSTITLKRSATPPPAQPAAPPVPPATSRPPAA